MRNSQPQSRAQWPGSTASRGTRSLGGHEAWRDKVTLRTRFLGLPFEKPTTRAHFGPSLGSWAFAALLCPCPGCTLRAGGTRGYCTLPGRSTGSEVQQSTAPPPPVYAVGDGRRRSTQTAESRQTPLHSTESTASSVLTLWRLSDSVTQVPQPQQLVCASLRC